MGHGGTLDPMATGVLVVGVGRGTKSLQSFLDCTKTYETVVLFGKSTDTYDVAGKVISTAGTNHITRDMVGDKLQAFRGKIKQVPPIYSALKIDGMKAYDYARTGKELPRELIARDMKVDECALIDWYEPGEHDFRWPAEEVASEEKAVLKGLTTDGDLQQSKNEDKLQGGIQAGAVVSSAANTRTQKAQQHTHSLTGLSDVAAHAPAARIRLTVSSGFYVRSFAHDLGLACASYGTMAELARTRQGAYTTTEPEGDSLICAVQHSDLDKGEEAWAPRITKVLSDWIAQNLMKDDSHPHKQFKQREKPFNRGTGRDREQNLRKRRNSSSPE